jgi:L-lactate dehydrogenase
MNTTPAITTATNTADTANTVNSSNNPTSIAIIGAGLVGSSAANALVLRYNLPVVLFDQEQAVAEAQAEDVRTAAIALGHNADIRAGSPNDLAQATVVVLAPGRRQKLGFNLNELLDHNPQTIRGLIRQLEEENPTAVRIIATQPVDIMTEIARAETAPERRSRVFGVGTALETIHLRHAIASRLGLHSRHIHGSVVGEAGVSALVLWSSVNVAGFPLVNYASERGITWNRNTELAIEDEVRRASQRISEGKGASCYGIGAVIARLVEAVVYDRRTVFTVAARTSYETVFSLPHLIGRDGLLDTIVPPLSGPELHRLEATASDLRETLAKI